jgi:hypothetical protein
MNDRRKFAICTVITIATRRGTNTRKKNAIDEALINANRQKRYQLYNLCLPDK